jgi:hypothetical protein
MLVKRSLTNQHTLLLTEWEITKEEHGAVRRGISEQRGAVTELQKWQAGISVFILRLSLKALLLFPESVPPSLIQELELPILEVTINVLLPAFVSTEEMSSFQYPQTNARTALHLHNTLQSSHLFTYISLDQYGDGEGGSYREADDRGGWGWISNSENQISKTWINIGKLTSRVRFPNSASVKRI